MKRMMITKTIIRKRKKLPSSISHLHSSFQEIHFKERASVKRTATMRKAKSCNLIRGTRNNMVRVPTTPTPIIIPRFNRRIVMKGSNRQRNNIWKKEKVWKLIIRSRIYLKVKHSTRYIITLTIVKSLIIRKLSLTIKAIPMVISYLNKTLKTLNKRL